MSAKKSTSYFVASFIAGLVVLTGALSMSGGIAWAKNDVVAPAEADLAANKLYTTYCLQCHGVNGLGDGPLAASLSQKPANLTRIKWKPDFMLKLKIREGRGVMPSWKNTLNEEQISSLVKYIRTFESAHTNKPLQKESTQR